MPKLIASVIACLLPITPAAALSMADFAAERGAAASTARSWLQALSTEVTGEAPDAEPGDAAAAAGAGESGLPTIFRSDADLPEPVRDMRRRLMDAARSGDIEQLRPLMEAQAEPPSVSFGDPGDPIEYLKQLSADADGREILAILLEVLESGFVHVQPGTPEELFVWPYFAQFPLEALTPGQVVELFTLLTAADLEDMKSFGGYTFFRVGIAPDGRWMFFVAGD
jgi:hypothetical protein